MSQVTVAFSAQGTALYVKIAGQGFQEITQIKTMSGPGITDKLADISTLSSLGGFEEVKPLMKKPTPLSGSLIWDPAAASHAYMQNSKVAYPATLEEFLQIASDPNGRTVHFFAYVTKWEPSTTTNEVGMINFEVTPTGAPGFSFVTSPA